MFVFLHFFQRVSLQAVMRLNALSCILFGLVFLLMPEAVADFLSASDPLPAFLISLLGGILLFNGFHLVYASWSVKLNRLLIAYFCFGDLLWVFATIALIAIGGLCGIGLTALEGIVASLLIAFLVLCFAILQWTSFKSQQA